MKMSSPESYGSVPRLGVDIGRVILSEDTDDPSRSIFHENYLEAPEVDGAIDTLRQERDLGVWNDIYLVSKCGPKVQDRTLEIFKHRDFYARTGIQPENVHFCRERAEKGCIAARLGLTHFIDDREEVLRDMPDYMQHRLLLNTEVQTAPEGIVLVRNWREIQHYLETNRQPAS